MPSKEVLYRALELAYGPTPCIQRFLFVQDKIEEARASLAKENEARNAPSVSKEMPAF